MFMPKIISISKIDIVILILFMQAVFNLNYIKLMIIIMYKSYIMVISLKLLIVKIKVYVLFKNFNKFKNPSILIISNKFVNLP